MDVVGQIASETQWIVAAVAATAVVHLVYLGLSMNQLLAGVGRTLDEDEQSRFTDLSARLGKHRLGMVCECVATVALVVGAIALCRKTPLWWSIPATAASTLLAIALPTTYYRLLTADTPILLGKSRRARLGRLVKASTILMWLAQAATVIGGSMWTVPEIHIDTLRLVLLFAGVFLGLVVLSRESWKSQALEELEELRSDVGRRETDPHVALLLLQGHVEGDSLHIWVANEWSEVRSAASAAERRLLSLESSLNTLFSQFPASPPPNSPSDAVLESLLKAVRLDMAEHNEAAKRLTSHYAVFNQRVAQFQHTEADDAEADVYRAQYSQWVQSLRARHTSADSKYKAWTRTPPDPSEAKPAGA